ncbi:MAG: hypothetical protein FJZ90_14535, partial [Chloroflexi bacterium]|nr:hypothetical protein [Chloroflexota bacterium]
MSRAAFVLAILASLTLSIAVQASQGIQDPPTPRRVSPGPGDDRYTALLVDVDGRAALSWLRRDPVGQVATLYVAQAPDWDAIPIVSLPYDATIQSALSSSPEGALELTWISSGPDGEAIRRHTLDGEVSLAWERRLPEPRAFTLDGDGRIHYAWADGAALVYEVESQIPPDERAAPAVRLSLDPGTIVDAIVLAVDAQGLAHLAWASRDALGQWGGVHYAPAIAGARPMRVASEGAAPHLAVGPSGIVHLCWQSTHALYYANSGNWEETRLIARDLTADAPVALAVGPQEMAHLAWSQGGYLWHSCSLDWASARRRVAEARDTSGLDLAIDGWGRPHLAWSSGGVRGGTYYLPPVSLSPQFRVTRPSGGDVLWRDTEARAETNLDEGALLRVEFYLESAEAPRDAPDNPLIELGSDHDGSDGWSAPIHVSRLDRGLCYRVMLLATDTEGTLIPAWGDWFRWVGPDESALWLPSRPPTEPEDPSPLTGGPIRGRTRLEALRLHGSWGAEEAMLPVSQDLYAVPVERGDQAVTCKALESLLSDAHYLGAYPVPRSEDEALVRQELGPLDSATLPDGHYVLVAMNTDSSGGQRFGGASRPFETNNSMYPSVVVESPRGGEIIQGDLRVS